MSLFGDIEKGIERGFKKWTERALGPAESGDLILLHRALLEEVERKVQVLARGRRVFPFPLVKVTLVAAEEERRTLLQAAFGERLESDLREMLAGTECEIPRGFAVTVETAAEGVGEYRIAYAAEPVKPVVASPAAATVAAAVPEEKGTGRLTVIKGKAARESYELERARVNLGRLEELTDADHRVVRRNDVVFEEGADEANATVSRRHAHIRLEAGEYRVCDDGSEFGTRVFRDGRSIEVPGGDRRGERLRSGDEIYLGRACVRFER